MKRSFLFLLFTSFTAGLLGTLSSSEAAGSKAPRATPTPSHQETIIASVSANAITVTMETVSGTGKVLQKTTRAFAITKFTEINVNGQRGTVADLKPGMKVSVTIDMDPSQAARINANG